MAVDQRRWIELFERLSAALGPEAATTLSELLPPRGTDVATSGDIAVLRREFVEQRQSTAAEFAKQRSELMAMEYRLAALFERRISEAVTTQTRTLVFSQLAALLAIAALAFGLR